MVKKKSEYVIQMENGETFHILIKKNDLVELNWYLWQSITEMTAILILLLYGYSIYQYHPKQVLLGVHFYFLLTMTSVRVILATVGELFSWKLLKIVPYILLLLICLIKILSYLQKHLSETGSVNTEFRVMGITILLMASSWNELISLIYFIFVVNGILSQYTKE